MQIRQLEYFLSLCKTLNFTRTAEAFFVSQTAVTQAIKALETELGTPLFIRTKRNVTLTPAGELLREDAGIILQQIAAAETRVRSASADMTGSLRIGFVAGYEHEGLVEALHTFHTIYPEVKLSVETESGDVLWRKLEADGLECRVIPRKELASVPISASHVRQAVQEGRFDDLKQMVPASTYEYFLSPEAEPVIQKIREAGNVVHY